MTAPNEPVLTEKPVPTKEPVVSERLPNMSDLDSFAAELDLIDATLAQLDTLTVAS